MRKPTDRIRTFCRPYTTIRKIIRNFFVKKHIEIWTNLDNCKHSRHFIKECSKSTTKYLLNKSRNDLRILISAITGHCTLNYHMHKMGLTPTTTCSKCNINEETPIHM